jgi:hypothetical protein
MPRWARGIVVVGVVVIWLPFMAAPVIGYLFLGWLGALVPLALYAACGLLFLLMWRSPRARRLGEVRDVDTSDPGWRNLMR